MALINSISNLTFVLIKISQANKVSVGKIPTCSNSALEGRLKFRIKNFLFIIGIFDKKNQLHMKCERMT